MKPLNGMKLLMRPCSRTYKDDLHMPAASNRSTSQCTIYHAVLPGYA